MTTYSFNNMVWSTIHKVCVSLLDESDCDKVHEILSGVIKTHSRRCLEETTETGVTALHFAALSEYPYILEILMEYGADLNVKNLNGETPLHWACASGNFHPVLVFVNFGVGLLEDRNGDTPLHWAIEGGKIQIAKFLAPRYQSLNQKINKSGISPLALAQRKNLGSDIFGSTQ